jgi:hypothetical protein
VAQATSNAITLTLRPAPASYADLKGVKIGFLLETTISVGGITVDVKDAAGASLAGGPKTAYKNFRVNPLYQELQAGQYMEVVYDGTYFQLMNPMAPATSVPALRGTVRGLAMSPNGANPNVQIDANFKELILEDAAGNTCIMRNAEC